jgi:endonuclease YncB( thermonuclease family)
VSQERSAREETPLALAIEQLRGSGLTVGHTGLGLRGQQNPAPGSARQQVHDGDTVTVRALGNLAVRFLGVDAPEESLPLLGNDNFVSIDNPKWDTFLNDPFASPLPPFKPALTKGLREHLAARFGAGAAKNHADHSDAARAAFIGEGERDMQTLSKTKDDFEFFLGFAHEVMDGYGRLLAYINRAQPNAEQPAPRPISYNERLLEQGMVTSGQTPTHSASPPGWRTRCHVPAGQPRSPRPREHSAAPAGA